MKDFTRSGFASAQLCSGNYGFTPQAALDLEGISTVLRLRNEYGRPKADFSNMSDFIDLSYYEQAIQSLEHMTSSVPES